jgi:putative endonuclease
MYYFYVLRSRKNSFLYKGITNDPKRREKERNLNKNVATRGKGPWKLVYLEKFETRLEARAREKYFKSGVGREKLKDIIFPGSSVGRARAC